MCGWFFGSGFGCWEFGCLGIGVWELSVWELSDWELRVSNLGVGIWRFDSWSLRVECLETGSLLIENTNGNVDWKCGMEKCGLEIA